MYRFINVGFGNVVNRDKIVSIIRPDAAPIKRMIQSAKDTGTAIDATCGRKVRAVVVLENGSVVLSALLPDTIVARISQRDVAQKGDDNETVEL